MNPTQRPDLVAEEMEETGELVLIDKATEAVVVLNASAAAVWYLCDGQRDEDAIAAEIHQTMKDESVEKILKDVQAIVGELRERKVLGG